MNYSSVWGGEGDPKYVCSFKLKTALMPNCTVARLHLVIIYARFYIRITYIMHNMSKDRRSLRPNFQSLLVNSVKGT